ncbi:Pfs domain-containing protein [Mycena venus]|uniref:Pfs domain-containing protein n=1 Tax=Mycena venus TaxID=2733690 RepID=A0A8H6XS67_9AGAR|nr:Pfs domain-containing protein [Mycena venus]
MAPPTTKSTRPPSGYATDSSSDKVLGPACTSLEAALKIFQLLSNVTKNVPYLNTITGGIQALIDIQKMMSHNKERTADLLDKIGELSRRVANGLHELGDDERRAAFMRLEDDLQRYEGFLRDTCAILTHWTSKSFMKRLWSHGDFPGIADGIDRRLDAFHDAFSVTRLIALSTGQDVLDAKIQSVIDKGIRNDLEKWLEPASVAVSQRDAANKRHLDTGKWLFERDEFIEWIYAPSSLLWLHGISGCGKTVLSSTIVSTLREKAMPLVFFYFDTTSSGQRTVTQLLCSLVNQLSVKAQPPDRRLNALWSSYNNGQHLPSNTALFADALLPILREIREPVYIILDALDECSERDKLLRLITEIMDARLLRVHVLVTSRPEVLHSSIDLVQRAVQVSFEGCTDPDIESYISERLSNFEIDWSDDRKNQIKTGLLKRGGGMFRLVSLQLDQLFNCDGRESQVAKALSDMPTSLDTIYARILQNISDPEMIANVVRAMNWLVFSRRPMGLNEIVDALAFDFDQEPLRFNPAERMRPKALLMACGGLITLLDNDLVDRARSKPAHAGPTLKIAHASVQEYFLGVRNLFARNPHGIRCEVSEQTAHRLIARTCIGYLCSLDRILQDDADLKQYPLTQYAAMHWEFHLLLYDGICGVEHRHQPRSQDKELLALVLALFQQDRPPYQTLCRLRDFDKRDYILRPRTATRSPPPFNPPLRLPNSRPVTILHPLYVGVRLGIFQVVDALLKQDMDVNMKCGLLGNVLQAACFEGHLEIAHLLIQHGADVTAPGGVYKNALQAAMYSGHTEIVRLLVKQNVDINARCGKFENALQAAVYLGDYEMVSLLAEHKVDMDAEGGKCRNGLQAAVCYRNTDIEYFLIDRGADMSPPNGEYGTALQAAAFHHHTDIARLLIARGADVNKQGGRYGNALQAASRQGAYEIASLLIEHGADVNNRGGEYGNAIQAAACYGHTEVVRLLINHGADVHMHVGAYANPLQTAACSGHIEIVRLLLEHKADVNGQVGFFGNALQAAACYGHIEILCLLLEHGADINAQGGTIRKCTSSSCVQSVHRNNASAD